MGKVLEPSTERVSKTSLKVSPVPVSLDMRRNSKPVMEKRRRARINASLAELKSLLLELERKTGSSSAHSKMEKADILEMTVKFLRRVQKQKMAAIQSSADTSSLGLYMSGFAECASEVSQYLAAMENTDVELRSRLLNHLANCVHGLASCTASSTASPSSLGTPPSLSIVSSSADSGNSCSSSVSSAQVSPLSPATAAVAAAANANPIDLALLLTAKAHQRQRIAASVVAAASELASASPPAKSSSPPCSSAGVSSASLPHIDLHMISGDSSGSAPSPELAFGGVWRPW